MVLRTLPISDRVQRVLVGDDVTVIESKSVFVGSRA